MTAAANESASERNESFNLADTVIEHIECGNQQAAREAIMEAFVGKSAVPAAADESGAEWRCSWCGSLSSRNPLAHQSTCRVRTHPHSDLARELLVDATLESTSTRGADEATAWLGVFEALTEHAPGWRDPNISDAAAAQQAIANFARQLAEAQADAHDQRWQHAQELKRADRAEAQLAEAREDAELPDGYRIERHVSGNWFYAVGTHASADYWPAKSRAIHEAWLHRERQLLRDLDAAIRRNGRDAARRARGEGK